MRTRWVQRVVLLNLRDVVIIAGLGLGLVAWWPESLPYSLLGIVLGNRIAALWRKG